MAGRSKSRTRTAASKSPGRPKKTPKSEPKKAATPKRTPSRSRSASRGRGRPAGKAVAKPAATPKETSKSPSRSRGRPVKTPVAAASAIVKSPAKTQAKTPSLKTPAVKTPSVKTPATAPIARAARSTERRIPLKIVSHDETSRSPVPRTARREPVRTYLSAQKDSQCQWCPKFLRGKGDALVQGFKNNSRDIWISVVLVAFIAALVFVMISQDPAKIRDCISSAPGKVQAWAKGVYASIRK